MLPDNLGNYFSFVFFLTRFLQISRDLQGAFWELPGQDSMYDTSRGIKSSFISPSSSSFNPQTLKSITHQKQTHSSKTTSTGSLTYHRGREVQRTAERDTTQELRNRSTQFYTQRGSTVHAELCHCMHNAQLAIIIFYYFTVTVSPSVSTFHLRWTGYELGDSRLRGLILVRDSVNVSHL